MKTICTFVNCLLICLISGGLIFGDGAGPDCWEPSPNDTYLCHTPQNAVNNCGAVSVAECASKAGYEINNFPQKKSANKGGVEEKLRDCWRSKVCVVVDVEGTSMCSYSPTYTAWIKMPKIEVKSYSYPEVEPVCSEEEPSGM